jgi:hypothetical protein
MSPRHRWTEDDLLILRRLYPHERTDHVAGVLGLTLRQVHSKANALGLKKSPAFFERPDCGRTTKGSTRGLRGQFAKGMTPHNKGKPFPHNSSTKFKPGMRPKNTVPVGTVTMSTPAKGESQGFLRRKIAEPNKWEFVHRAAWEQVHGPIPSGHVLAFIDGDRRNCGLSNLRLITRAENLVRQSVHNLPPELKQVCQLKGAINRVINRREKSA